MSVEVTSEMRPANDGSNPLAELVWFRRGGVGAAFLLRRSELGCSKAERSASCFWGSMRVLLRACSCTQTLPH